MNASPLASFAYSSASGSANALAKASGVLVASCCSSVRDLFATSSAHTWPRHAFAYAQACVSASRSRPADWVWDWWSRCVYVYSRFELASKREMRMWACLLRLFIYFLGFAKVTMKSLWSSLALVRGADDHLYIWSIVGICNYE